MVDFIQKHHVLSMATVEDETPVSCSLFYLFVPEEACFIFASDKGTEHMKNISENPYVSASIHDETKEVMQIRGIQIKGMVSRAEDKHEDLYLEAYPYAKNIDEKSIWKLSVTGLKFTDNTQEFARKEMWNY